MNTIQPAFTWMPAMLGPSGAFQVQQMLLKKPKHPMVAEMKSALKYLYEKDTDAIFCPLLKRIYELFDESKSFEQLTEVGYLQFVKFFVHHGSVDFVPRKYVGEAYQYVAHHGLVEFLPILYQYSTCFQSDEFNLLGTAAFHGQLEVMQWLIDHGADVNSENGVPLEQATQGGEKAIEFLLDHGAIPTERFIQFALKGDYGDNETTYEELLKRRNLI